MRKLYIAGLVLVAALVIGIAIADEVIISTFYPAPFGQYRQFTTTGKTLLATDEWGIELDNACVGIGTTNPQAKLHVAGEDGVDGIKFPDDTLQTTAAGAFGSWTNKDSQNNTLVVNAVYKAECDGSVCVAAYGSGHGNGSIEGFTDGINATTRRVGSGSGYVDVHWSGITMPVKKNDYWKVTTYRMLTPSISWIPIGSGSCVKQ